MPVPSPASPETAVSVHDLTVRYGSKVAVDRLSFDVQAGSITALLGPNGAGKTSTVSVIEGLAKPSDGEVHVLGKRPGVDPARVGVMLQSHGIPAAAKVREVISAHATFYRDPLDVSWLMTRLDLNEVRSTFRRMSGGEQQRVKLALALVGRPELVILDEPTAGLDPHARHSVWELVAELRQSGVTVLMTTHYMDEAERLADDVIIIDRGRLVAQGSPSQLAGGADEVSFRGPLHLDLTSLNSVLPDDLRAAEGPPGTYRVVSQDSELAARAVATITAWGAQHGVRGLTVGRRSLEDVYLTVTGRSWEESA